LYGPTVRCKLRDAANDGTIRLPVDICFGTRPSHAAKSRPFAKAVPLPIAATIALAMIGPTLGTVINCRQPARQGLDFIRHVFDSLIEMRPVADKVPNNPDHTGDT
jgi:hypothetical protein